MRRTPVVSAILVLCAAVSSVWRTAEAQNNSELAGGWIVSNWETPDGQVDSEPQRGLFVFTASGHYSIMYVLGDQPRVEWAGEIQSDADKLTSYDSFIANSGRYSVEGNQITYEAYMAKNPNFMARFGPEGENAATMTFNIEDGVLTLRFTSGYREGWTVTFRRPGQPSN